MTRATLRTRARHDARSDRFAICGLMAGFVLAAVPAPAHAQDPARPCDVVLTGADFVGASADVARMVDLLGDESTRSFLIRRISDRVSANACTTPRAVEDLARSLSVRALPSHGAALLPVDGRLAVNTGYPRDWNDGAQWSAVGLSTTVTAGAVFHWGRVEAAISPVIGLRQNSWFVTHPYPDTASYSRYIDRWHGRYIDLPQRFGSNAAGIANMGQSYLR
ncbi:MAG: hypothetical protein ACREK1_10345, partial [Longimicrobiales bacterium]